MSRCETANGWMGQNCGGHKGVHESYSTDMLPIIFLFPLFLFFFLFKNPPQEPTARQPVQQSLRGGEGVKPLVALVPSKHFVLSLSCQGPLGLDLRKVRHKNGVTF